MENYQTGLSCGRPYRTTCGMNRMPSRDRMQTVRQVRRNTQTADAQTDCREQMQETYCRYPSKRSNDISCRMPGTASREPELYEHADRLVPAMAYVPCQKFSRAYDLDYALQAGTVFPELCRPFCGKRGVRK